MQPNRSEQEKIQGDPDDNPALAKNIERNLLTTIDLGLKSTRDKPAQLSINSYLPQLA